VHGLRGQSGKVSWQELADWLSARGFGIEKARPLYFTLAAPEFFAPALVGCTVARSCTDCLT